MASELVLQKKNEIASVYIDVMKDIKLNPLIDQDGDVEFETTAMGGIKLVAIIDADHPEFLRIAIPGLSMVTKSNRLKVLEACNYVNLNSKVVKTYISSSQEYVWAAYEMVMPSLNKKDLSLIVAIALNVLESASLKFVSYMRENA